MNIVVINDFNYVQGGASKVAIETAKQLYNQGHKVYLFCGVYDKNIQYDFEVLTTDQEEMVHASNKIVAAWNNIYNKKAYIELTKLLNSLDKKNTIVHIHGWTKCLSSSVFNACYKAGVKNVLTAHDYFTVCPNGGFYNYKSKCICKKKPMSFDCIKTNCDSRNLSYKIFRVIRQMTQNYIVCVSRKINHLISISSFSENILMEHMSPENVYRLYNPTSIENIKNRINCEENDYYIFIGRLSDEKGIVQLLEAVSRTNHKLKIVGEGPLMMELKAKYITNDNIIFLGWLSQDMVLEQMRTAKALVFPSVWYEGAPLVIFEALANGLPCFVSKDCAAVDFIRHSYNGLHFDPYNECQINETMNAKSEDIKKFSQNSYKEYWDNPYTIERYTNELIEVYKKILSK